MYLDSNKLSTLHKRYPKKRAAITGAGSGLGKSLALELIRHGWTLFLNDVNKTLLKETKSNCQNLLSQSDTVKIYDYHFDVSNYNEFSNATKQFLANEGGVDLVFTCAGIGVGGSFLETSNEDFTEVLDINLLGTIWAGKLFLPSMVEANSGHFITIASAAAFHSLPHLSGYSASKAAVVQLSETLRSEMKPHGVDITVKMTTFYTSSIGDFTRGPMMEQEKAKALVAMAPWSAKEVAKVLLLTVQKRKFYMVAPKQASFLWRFKRFLPEIYLRLVPKLFPKLEAKLLTKSAEIGINNDV
jgi:short-subunit dehydrogenase